jgi:diadenosine tetraphosphate (Ap4A) HIT family hydrolase
MTTTDTSSCFFCRLVAGLEPSWKIWEDEEHLAFLTPFPNTPGFTVVAPKKHLGSYVFSLEDAEFTALLRAARKVGLILDRALGTRRTGLIAEGMGIDHAHVKLTPLHGIPEGPWKSVRSTVRTFYTRYEGYIASHDGPRMSDEELTALAERIREAATGA